MSKVFEWDELNILREDARYFIREAKQKKPDRKAVDGFCDYMEFVLCLVYAYGWKDAEEIVGTVPMKDGFDDRAVNTEIAGETWRERVAEQIDLLSEEGLIRIIETESTRDYSTGVLDAGNTSGVAVQKRWNTMLDWRVRDSHQYLEGMVVGMDDLFYTEDGDSAYAPGGFEQPEHNCNCRCYISLVR